MTQAEHTPEPWEVCPDLTPDENHMVTVVPDENGVEQEDMIITVFHGKPDVQRLTAERLVACVNACAGLNPEAIPAAVEALEVLVKADGYTDHEHRRSLTHPHYACPCRRNRYSDLVNCNCGFAEAMKPYNELDYDAALAAVKEVQADANDG